jgi:hypothetical protein
MDPLTLGILGIVGLWTGYFAMVAKCDKNDVERHRIANERKRMLEEAEKTSDLRDL